MGSYGEWSIDTRVTKQIAPHQFSIRIRFESFDDSIVATTREDIDCSEGKVLTRWFSRQEVIDGKEKTAENPDPRWEKVKPQTIFEEIYRKVCARLEP